MSGTRPDGFDEVLAEELGAIHARRERLDLLKGQLAGGDHDDPRDRAWNARLLGLAFSGGGIRSATFNLGVLQALAGYGLLRHVDYLSTVSGGGYIGAWLTALAQRTFACAAPKRDGGEGALGASPADASPADADASDAGAYDATASDATASPDLLLPFDSAGYRRFERSLAQAAGRQVDRTEREHEAVRFLRAFSNYLTPKLGMFSGDTWAMLSIYLRNALLNQLVLVLALTMVLLAPRWLSSIATVLGRPNLPWEWGLWTVLVLAAVGLVAWQLGTNLAGVTDTQGGEPSTMASTGVIARILLPLLAIGISATLWLPALSGLLQDLWSPTLVWLVAAAAGGLIAASIWLGAGISARRSRGWLASEQAFWKSMLLYAPVAGIVFGVGMHAAGVMLIEQTYAGFALVVTPPLFALGILTAGVLHVGLAGKSFSSHYTEWLSRLGGIMLIGTLGWLAITAAAFLGPLLVAMLEHYYLDLILGAIWVATTLGAVGLGTERTTSRVRAMFLAIAPWVFITGLVLLVSAVLQKLLARLAAHVGAWRDEAGAARTRLEEHFDGTGVDIAAFSADYGAWLGATEPLLLLLAVSGIVVALTWGLSSRIDINTFSLNSMYGNRLVRCYLGASVEDRRPNPFSGLSAQDDLGLSACARKVGGATLLVHRDAQGQLPGHSEEPEAAKAAAYPGPYLLVNTAINLVTGGSLAWQERKAGAFLLSPLYCGYHWESGNDHDAVDAYRSTADFSSTPESRRLTLGEAMATSGAAASPNMGHRTTAPLAFLLGIFNIRLGRWVGNPASLDDDAWKRTGPEIALWHLLREVFGLTNSDSRFVYVSDGGHFDNLGLYELVRRQCRYIVLCDSGADPEYRFEDLGNAIRKCRIDLGVEIELDVRQIAERDARRHSAAPCAVGNIRYGRDRVGTILYIKASRRDDLPSDVMHYAAENLAFPHEPTVDQFFSESQFESYRRLGHFLATEVIGSAVTEGSAGADDTAQVDDVDHLFRVLRQNWHAPSSAVAANFGRLGAQVDALFERLRTSPRLAFLSQQFYPEWGGVSGQPAARPGTMPDVAQAQALAISGIPEDEETFREGFYFCNSLIQLMESVYLDLELESHDEHPDNSGWINLFHHWAWSGMFRATWAVCAATYGRRFRNYCERRLGLDLGRVRVATAFDGTQPNAGIAAALASSPLNLLERRQVLDLMREIDATRIEVYALILRIRNPLADMSQREEHQRAFAFGYAVVSEEQLLMYRVQDHLRKMNLGRRGLRELVEHRDKGELRLTDDVARHLRWVKEPADPGRLADFRAMLVSVNEEWMDEAGRRWRQAERATL